jgi:hypothetical protein
MNLEALEKLNYDPLFQQFDNLGIWPPILADSGRAGVDPDPEKVIE